ncbi:LacI family transcriptional regulator [Haloactinopolyspora alba]|uniref:LacI family transcriptional regulator n=1 Tax=Haloactinopolyspora alba TaxID=648780 RepID=A0A2P8E9J9_9ACTN|nr:LacI family transcriptional regulator [Haloactinopolyspora alba]
MNDVARHAGVGLKTVSRVVNGEPRVSSAMVQRVRQAIEDLGFRRHEGARLLRRGRTACVGLVLEDVADPFSSALTRAVESEAWANGFLLLTGSSGEDAVQERELTLAFCAGRVDGVVVVPAGDDHRYLAPEIEAGVAAVFADRPAGRIEADAVLVDNTGGARLGVGHLLEQGHRRIGHIGDAEGIFTAGERQRGYREALEAAEVPYDPSLVARGPVEQEFIRHALDRMLAGPEPVTAVFTGNNRATVAVIRDLATRERRPALVGFDDFELADMLSPAVTVVAQDAAVLGRTAAQVLFQRLGGDVSSARTIELQTRLIPRGSGEIPA